MKKLPDKQPEQSKLWHAVFDAIWEESKTETGWVLIGEHVMTTLERMGLIQSEESILVNSLRFLDDAALKRLKEAIEERIAA